MLAMQPYLVTYNEVFELTRKMSVHLDRDRIDSFIREAEDMDLKPVLGDGLMIALKRDAGAFGALLNGGAYVDADGHKRVFAGLKSALAYFTYARFVRNGDGHVTRSGFTVKENEHSVRASEMERERTWNDVRSIGERYLRECMDFVAADDVCRSLCGGRRNEGGRYKVLGD